MVAVVSLTKLTPRDSGEIESIREYIMEQRLGELEAREGMQEQAGVPGNVNTDGASEGPPIKTCLPPPEPTI